VARCVGRHAFSAGRMWEAQWGNTIAPKNFNLWYYFGRCRLSAGAADRHRDFPDDELQADADTGAIRLQSNYNHARRCGAAGSSATCIRTGASAFFICRHLQMFRGLTLRLVTASRQRDCWMVFGMLMYWPDGGSIFSATSAVGARCRTGALR